MVSVQYTEGSDSPPVPLSQRRQLIVNVADGLARNKPQGTYGYLPVSALGYEKGFRRVSYRQFANMVNGLAWWLTATLGRSSSFEAITYVGPNDFVHNAMVLASVKCGYKLLLASPRNQPDAYKFLLEQVGCKALLSADPRSPLTAMMCEVFPMPTFQVPSMEVLLTEHFAHYPYTKTFEEAKSDPLLVLHTSGTTSLPKPLTFTNEFTGAYAHALELPVEPGMETKEMYFSGNRMFTTMPPFHAAYLFTTFWMGLLKETTVILPPSQITPSLDVFIEGIQRIEVSTAFIQPSFISQLASNQEYLGIAAQNVETILASAGNIFDSAVDAVSSRVRLITVFGATEVGGLPDVIPLSTKLAPRDAGAYIHPHPGTGMEFRLYASTEAEQIYEAWIVRNADPRAVQPIFTMFPDATERSTRDLFTPHPTKPNHWRWHSRVDDTVALSTGANVSPASMETGLSQHSAVQGVLMLGNSRVRPLLLVELKDHSSYEQDEVKSDIWSTIERLNGNYHQDHKILKSHLIIAKENKSLLRSLKGSIQRRFTEDLYRSEIEEIYSDVSDGVQNDTNGY